MSKRILILKNISHEEPGLLIDVINRYYLPYDVIDLSKKLNFPKIDDYALLIIMGGPDSANDFSEKIIKESYYVKLAFHKKIPILGICLGLQLMIHVNGGEIFKNKVEEVGFKHKEKFWCTIKLTEEGLRDPVFENINDSFIVFQLHGETVKLIKRATLLGTSKLCRNQILKIGDYNYGFQFHFELNEDLFWKIHDLSAELINHDLNQLEKDFNIIKESYTKRGTRICENYLKLIKFIM